MTDKIGLVRCSPERYGRLLDHFAATGELLFPVNPGGLISALATNLPHPCLAESALRTASATQTAGVGVASSEARIVVIGAADASVPVAKLFAIATGATLLCVSDVSNFRCEDLPASARTLLLVAPPAAFSDDLLSQIWRHQLGVQLDVGLIPCRNALEFEAFVLKRLFGRELYRQYRGAAVLVRDRAEGLDFQPDVIREPMFSAQDAARLQRPLQFICAEFHAKETCAKFNNHVLCGLPSRTSAEVGGVRPGCADGRPCIWTALKRLPVDSLQAAHLIAVSCGSLRLELGLFDSRYGLGLNAFHGSARSFISPTRFIVASSLLSGLLCDVVMSGQTLGATVRQVNAFVASSGEDAPSFVLLGDPDDRVDIEAAYNGAEEPSLVAPGRTTASAKELPAHIDPAQHPFPPGLLRGLAPSPGKPEATTDMLQAMLYKDGREGLWPSLLYMDGHKLADDRNTCIYCGQKCIAYRRADRTGRWERDVINCPRCGLIADVPAGQTEKISLVAPRSIAVGEDLKMTSRLRGDAGRRASRCGFSLIHSSYFGWSDFEECQPIIRKIRDGASVSQTRVVPAGVFPFVYWLRVTWLSEDGFYWASRPLIVTGRADLASTT